MSTSHRFLCFRAGTIDLITILIGYFYKYANFTSGLRACFISYNIRESFWMTRFFGKYPLMITICSNKIGRMSV